MFVVANGSYYRLELSQTGSLLRPPSMFMPVCDRMFEADPMNCCIIVITILLRVAYMYLSQGVRYCAASSPTRGLVGRSSRDVRARLPLVSLGCRGKYARSSLFASFQKDLMRCRVASGLRHSVETEVEVVVLIALSLRVDVASIEFGQVE